MEPLMSVDTDTTDDVRIVDVTDIALEKVIEIRADEDDPETLGLRIEVIGVNGADFTYDLAFESLDESKPDDVITEIGTLSVVVPADSVDKLRGSVLDLPAMDQQGGLVLRNPNRPDTPDPLTDLGDLELTGSLSEKVTQLLEQAVNPALASHGGFASLAGVDDENRVFVHMGGGCQGCSLSAATLQEGIQRAIREALPEVTDVIDATDHDAGENPFY
jgi:Fe/S biogenesis protein NfuA